MLGKSSLWSLCFGASAFNSHHFSTPITFPMSTLREDEACRDIQMHTNLHPSITGLATASILRSKGHDITIIARDLPPANGIIDLSTASKVWASP